MIRFGHYNRPRPLIDHQGYWLMEMSLFNITLGKVLAATIHRSCDDLTYILSSDFTQLRDLDGEGTSKSRRAHGVPQFFRLLLTGDRRFLKTHFLETHFLETHFFNFTEKKVPILKGKKTKIVFGPSLAHREVSVR